MPTPFPTHATVAKLRDLIAQELTESETPDLDALILIETVSARNRADLLAEFRSPSTAVLDDEALRALASLVEKRRRGDSIAYITGVKEFFGYEFRVGPGTLVPRPESEHLVEEGMRVLDMQPHAVIHDCCTGTGCVGIALARERANHGYSTTLVLSDFEPEALVWAARNADQLLAPISAVNYSVHARNLLQPVLPNPRGATAGYDLITANPPYLTTEELQRIGLNGSAEPVSALDGGMDGLRVYPELASQAFAWLLPERYVLVEHGWTQGFAVRTVFERAGFECVDTGIDLAGRERLVRARRPAGNS